MDISVLLAHSWEKKGKPDPTNWIMSEKLDGLRAYWNGSGFYSRNAKPFYAPKWFTKTLPKDLALDGELWMGRGQFQKCTSAVKKHVPIDSEWANISYCVFDAPKHPGPYEKRMEALKEAVKEIKHVIFVGLEVCTGSAHLDATMKAVLAKGGEGVMLRKPKSAYVQGRSAVLLKVKPHHDEEAKVIGHQDGTGRCSGMLGALMCVLPNNVKFKVGSGFDDAQRKKPPKIGSIITFKYQEVSERGVPRHPVFLRERRDVTWVDVCEGAKSKVPVSQLPKIQAELKRNKSLLFTEKTMSDMTSASSASSSKAKKNDEDAVNVGGDANSRNGTKKASPKRKDKYRAEQLERKQSSKERKGASSSKTWSLLDQFSSDSEDGDVQHVKGSDNSNSRSNTKKRAKPLSRRSERDNKDDMSDFSDDDGEEKNDSKFSASSKFSKSNKGEESAFKFAGRKRSSPLKRKRRVRIDEDLLAQFSDVSDDEVGDGGEDEDADFDGEDGGAMSDDEGELGGELSEDEVQGLKAKCRYGSKCYQRNPKHKAKFWHPKPKPSESSPKKRRVDE